MYKKTKLSSQRKDIVPNRFILVIAVLIAIMTNACTGHLRPPGQNIKDRVKNQEFVIVTVKAEDTLSSLAQIYLKDSRKEWWIAAYNNTQSISPGQKLVIPLAPVTYGGLYTDGYQTVPVLLYDQVSQASKNSRAITAQQFDHQLLFLKKNRYHTLRMDELYAFLSLEDHIPPKSVIISFDTVGAWVYDIVYPLLKKYGMTASVFITTEEIDKPGNLNWKQVAKMAADGFDIGTLGSSGKDLLTLRPGENARAHLKRIEKDITTAKSLILKHTKSTCRYFAYPSGKDNDLLTAILKKHGFQAAFTRKRGSNPFFVNAFQLRRSSIYGEYDMDKFKQNIVVFHSAELK